MNKTYIVILSIAMFFYLLSAIVFFNEGTHEKIKFSSVFRENHVEKEIEYELENIKKIVIEPINETVIYTIDETLGDTIIVKLKGTLGFKFRKDMYIEKEDETAYIKIINSDIFMDIHKNFTIEVIVNEENKNKILVIEN